MSFTRTKYDDCAQRQYAEQATSPLSYSLDINRYDNCKKCRMELGLVGGTGVSIIEGNLVDLDSELRGVTREASRCSSKKYQNACAGENDCQMKQIPLGSNPSAKMLDVRMKHLPPCQMFAYKAVALPPPMKLPTCSISKDTSSESAPKPFNI